MVGGSWWYRAFGLTLESGIALEGLESVPPTADRDVSIQMHEPGVACTRSHSDAVRISWDGVCDLTATAGNQLDVYPLASASPNDVQLAVLGAGLALILEQRGVVVLHGSCVDVDGVAVCFAGPSGAGKSTIAAALGRAGHPILSDGMTAIDVRDDGAWVRVGVPLLKLMPDAVERLGWFPDRLPRVHDSSPKLACEASDLFASQALRLGLIVILAAEPTLGSTPVGPSAAAFELVKNYFLIDELRQSRSGEILQASAAIARIVPVRRLGRAGLDELPQLVQLVTALVRDPGIVSKRPVASSRLA